MAVVKDPVCGMEIEEGEAAAQTVHEGKAYFFCSEDCRNTFEAQPEEFINEQDS